MITFTVITPCKNAEKHILDTMMSIQRQSAFEKNLAKLEYIIVDGESNDNTLKIINENKTKDLKLIVKKDNNMYEGLTRGLEIASGDIISYLNAGDIYNFNAFEVLNKIFKNNNNFWVTSNKILINENNEITNISLPFVYRKRFIRNGLYGKYFPFIQQESTFWKKELNSLINFNNLKKFKYAGDAYIWSRFANKYKLKIINSYLGSFKIHENQLSSNIYKGKNLYKLELSTLDKRNFFSKIIDIPLIIFDYFFWIISKFQISIFKFFAPGIYISSNKNNWDKD